MHSDYHSDQIVAGLKVALEQPNRIKFLREDLALFFTEECVHKLEKVYEGWWCNCKTFQAMREYHCEPICLHTVAVGRITREGYENVYWLYQAHENLSTTPREQPSGEVYRLKDERHSVVPCSGFHPLKMEILRA